MDDRSVNLDHRPQHEQWQICNYDATANYSCSVDVNYISGNHNNKIIHKIINNTSVRCNCLIIKPILTKNMINYTTFKSNFKYLTYFVIVKLMTNVFCIRLNKHKINKNTNFIGNIQF